MFLIHSPESAWNSNGVSFAGLFFIGPRYLVIVTNLGLQGRINSACCDQIPEYPCSAVSGKYQDHVGAKEPSPKVWLAGFLGYT